MSPKIPRKPPATGGNEKSAEYRMKLLTERLASGPFVAKNIARPTWRLTEHTGAGSAAEPVQRPATDAAPKRAAPSANEQPDGPGTVKQPRLSPAPVDIDLSRYNPTSASADAQGYYTFMSRPGHNKAVEILYGFPGSIGNYVQVDPPGTGLGAPGTQLKNWTDVEIWQLYGIHGQAIERFRIEAQASGRPPQWVEPISTGNPFKDLLAGPLRWMHPDLSLEQRRTVLQPYNLLPSQLSRLQQHLQSELTLPEWVHAHKRLLDDLDNPQRLDQFSQQAAEELNLKRNASRDWYDPEASMTGPLREALLTKLGYQRNKYNCLYRTDIPALFRGDERTPFELANDNTMLPRYDHEPGATSLKPMSATFSLKEGQRYAETPDAEYLRFNSQTHKHPGRDADDSSPDSDSSDTESSDASDDSDAGSPIPWDHERHYERTRERQTEMFLYALDTRHLEVVPHEENHRFNSAARDTPPTWFPDDDLEGLISVSKKGLAAQRIWFLNSALSKGAKVHDLNEQAGERATRIEAATHAGHANKHEYDRLIDEVEAAGKPILRLSGNKNEYAYDIVWPT